MKEPKSVSILVVDDEEATCWGLCRLLGRDGYETDSAPNGLKALEKINRKEYDVVITDMKMPALNGLDLIEAIRDRYHGRIILMTAFGTAETFYRALDSGVHEYINKPIDYAYLLELIREITEKESPR